VSNNSNGINHKKLTRHHIIPRSRGGGNGENVVEIPTHQHECWHAFFGNLNPIEAIEFIEIVFLGKGRRKKKKKWTQEDLYKLQIKMQERTLRRKQREALKTTISPPE
jgi:hypothetical protein